MPPNQMARFLLILVGVVGTMASAAPPALEQPEFAAPAAPADQDILINNDPHKRYFLIGPRPDAQKPADGYKLLLVLPGGDGSADFHPFVMNIFKNSLSNQYVLAQLVAPQWSPDQAERIVWPTANLPWKGMKFTTEQFIGAVIEDVAKRVTIDQDSIFTLSWSSSGPAAYAASLTDDTPIDGSLVAMSVFRADDLPDMSNAKDKTYYLLHSPQDRIPIQMAEDARDQLRAHGAQAKLQTYQGGHGWHGDPFAMIRDGIKWLEVATSQREAAP